MVIIYNSDNLLNTKVYIGVIFYNSQSIMNNSKFKFRIISILKKSARKCSY